MLTWRWPTGQSLSWHSIEDGIGKRSSTRSAHWRSPASSRIDAAESHALCQIGGALIGTGDRAGYEPLERSLSLALEHGLEDHGARAYRTLQFYAGLIRDFPRAERAFHEGVEYCEERGIFSHSA